MTEPVRHQRIPGTYNFRDTGGYAADGGTTRWGKLYRSDELHRLTDEGRVRLAEIGIRSIIDLRRDKELVTNPPSLGDLDIEVVHVPIVSGNVERSAMAAMTLDEVYLEIVRDFGSNLVSAIRAIARSGDKPVIVHCAAGKDRTGIVIGMALLAVGVSLEDVLSDYEVTATNLSGEWLENRLLQFTDLGIDRTPELEFLVGASPRYLLDDVNTYVDKEYGSVVRYLLANGLEADELAELKRILVT